MLWVQTTSILALIYLVDCHVAIRPREFLVDAKKQSKTGGTGIWECFRELFRAQQTALAWQVKSGLNPPKPNTQYISANILRLE
ncbi:hypothetical protein HUJ05_002230 [Dendroctonus ponderosae]|nr:hypothetical protein HUJ05_002230 [Dendroctonus ponderosae]